MNKDGPTGAVGELDRVISAEPQRLAGLRRELADWAQRTPLSAEQAEAMVLSTYEALANAAEHAYPDGEGVLQMHARYQPAEARVEVTVTDHGQWRAPPCERNDLGGRGLVLIDALADDVEVTLDGAGTRVWMLWQLDSTRTLA